MSIKSRCGEKQGLVAALLHVPTGGPPPPPPRKGGRGEGQRGAGERGGKGNRARQRGREQGRAGFGGVGFLVLTNHPSVRENPYASTASS